MITTVIADDGNENASSKHSVSQHRIHQVAGTTLQLKYTTTPDSKNTSHIMELALCQSSQNLIMRRSSQEWSEVDAALRSLDKYTVSNCNLIWTLISIVMRAFTVAINISLAYGYWSRGQQQYFAWTSICIVVPMCITLLIHANMCHQDGKFSEGTCKALQTLWLVFLSSFLFRYLNSLRYSINCKQAERLGDREAQMKYYKLMVREESDIAFIRLFECFLEAAPQKVLLISIVLTHVDRITIKEVIAICSYFGSTAWCLSVYHRYNRYAQIDKHNIKKSGHILQLLWHFCITVSRSCCIAFVASLFPLWTLLACLSHALFFGFVTFIVDRPKFACTPFLNFLFCLVIGIIYLFTYIAVKDGTTKRKYLLYYSLCISENIICVVLFYLYASSDLVSLAYLFYPLCALVIALYCIGIGFMIVYYFYFHPNITARTSKLIINNNQGIN